MEEPMHAVVARVTIHHFERGVAALRGELVPRVGQAPGVIAAHRLRSQDGGGMSVILLESEDAAARGLVRHIEAAGPPTDAVTVDGVDVHEVVARL
jgi:hypothetical protein